MQKHPDPIPGTYQANPKGYGFVIPDAPDGGGDWFIPPGQALGAWDGDSVTLLPIHPDRREGKVAGVTRRANQTVTGTLRRTGGRYFLVPDRERLRDPILLTGKGKGISPGLRAAAEVVSYGTVNSPAMGTLKEVFGPGGTRDSAQAAILYNYGVRETFPEEVEEQAAAISRVLSPADLAGRRDFRPCTIVTIDSASAKDLDDAVSLTLDQQGRRVLGVHIADVSHYVPPHTPLDAEALHRGTSVYYVNRVAPMLPTPLSNGICSLNPQVDRLVLSCLMTLDDQGQVVGHTLCQGVIRTAARLNYAEVNAFLEGQEVPPGPLAPDDPQAASLGHLVTGLDVLARQRRGIRARRGALELTSTECHFVLDENGKTVAVEPCRTGRGESLIEECMLLANETVAQHLAQAHLPGVFRVHEKPSEEKISALRALVAPLGFNLKDGSAPQLQALLDKFQDTPMAGAVNMMVLRSLMKARYDPQNLGHFGLGADYYCHFTSPIRRYPDLVVHRVITALLTGSGMKTLQNFIPTAARQSSEREVAAQNAEREIEKLYMADYLTGKIGQTFNGIITGVTKFGLFVSLDNGVEGLLPLEALPDDRYDLDASGFTLVARRTGQTYPFGAPLQVKVAAADPSTGKISFVLPSAGIPSGIFVQTKHRLDTRKGRSPCSKPGSRRSPGPRGRKKNRRS